MNYTRVGPILRWRFDLFAHFQSSTMGFSVGAECNFLGKAILRKRVMFWSLSSLTASGEWVPQTGKEAWNVCIV